MIGLSPTARLEWLLQQNDCSDAHPAIQELIGRYEEFLQRTDEAEEKLVLRFMDKEQSAQMFKTASDLGNSVFDALEAIGKRNRFHRLLVV